MLSGGGHLLWGICGAVSVGNQGQQWDPGGRLRSREEVSRLDPTLSHLSHDAHALRQCDVPDPPPGGVAQDHAKRAPLQGRVARFVPRDLLDRNPKDGLAIAGRHADFPRGAAAGQQFNSRGRHALLQDCLRTRQRSRGCWRRLYCPILEPLSKGKHQPWKRGIGTDSTRVVGKYDLFCVLSICICNLPVRRRRHLKVFRLEVRAVPRLCGPQTPSHSHTITSANILLNALYTYWSDLQHMYLQSFLSS